MASTLIKNARIINEGRIVPGDVLIEGERIALIASEITAKPGQQIIDAQESYLLPGLIDDQVHFREPGLTHKADLYTEPRAAVAGGITSFIEMPNTVPNTLTQELLEQKFQLAAGKSLANYSFMMGVSLDNVEEVLKTNARNVAGVKIFMGSSTGNMLVDDPGVLETLFSKCELLIATHCEDEQTIRNNIERYRQQYGEDVPIRYHPEIRSAEACYLSSSYAVNLAKKHGTRLHVFHLSTARETALFDHTLPLSEKRITAEVCIHHLWFHDKDYDAKGTHIKWNPAVKTAADRDGLWEALLDDRIDVIATDHAPHTLEEKQNSYFKAPSGGPLVQHALVALYECYKKGKISLERIIEKACHAPATLFRVEDRGFIREGYYADLVLLKPDAPWQVTRDSLFYKCGWSPFEGENFGSRVTHTFVNGHLAYHQGHFDEGQKGKRLLFGKAD